MIIFLFTLSLSDAKRRGEAPSAVCDPTKMYNRILLHSDVFVSNSCLSEDSLITKSYPSASDSSLKTYLNSLVGSESGESLIKKLQLVQSTSTNFVIHSKQILKMKKDSFRERMFF